MSMQTEFQTELEMLLTAFEGYYDINRENPQEPFLAEADFRMHDEQYFLTRSARLTESDSREILFFAGVDVLTGPVLDTLAGKAWESVQSRAEIKQNHHFTDAGLLILARHIPEEVVPLIRKAWKSKSYLFGLRGYSRFRLAAADLTKRRIIHSRQAESLEEAVRKTVLKGSAADAAMDGNNR